MMERLIYVSAILVCTMLAFFQYRVVKAQNAVMVARAEIFQERINMTEQKLRMMRAARDIVVLYFFDADKERPDLDEAIMQLPRDPRFTELVKAVVAYREKQPGGNSQRVMKALKELDKELGL